MRTLASLLAFALMPIVVHAAPQTAAVDRSTPEKTVQSLLDAALRYDLRAMVDCVSTASPTAPGMRELADDLRKGPQLMVKRFLLEQPSLKERPDGSVELTVRVKHVWNDGAPVPPELGAPEAVILKKEEGGWRVIPRTPEQQAAFTPDKEEKEGTVELVANMVRYPEAILRSRARARTKISFQYLRTVVTGVMLFVEDNEGKFALRPETYKDSVMPYIKVNAVFTSPFDPPGTLSYQFNLRLAGLHVSRVRDPSKTVMMYEGRWSRPLFRNDGKALITTVDGETHLLTAEQVKELRWVP